MFEWLHKYECVMCHTRQRGNRFAPVVIDDHRICISCVLSHNHPGKFESYAWENRKVQPLECLATALILYSFMLDNGEDAYMSNEGWGYCGQFGQYLLFEDPHGFVTYEDLGSEEKAYKYFNNLYEDGWGASEYDAYISFDRGKYCVTFDGNQLSVWSNRRVYPHDEFNNQVDFRRCVARVRLEAIKTGMYPDLWSVGYGGDLTLVNY